MAPLAGLCQDQLSSLYLIPISAGQVCASVFSPDCWFHHYHSTSVSVWLQWRGTRLVLIYLLEIGFLLCVNLAICTPSPQYSNDCSGGGLSIIQIFFMLI